MFATESVSFSISPQICAASSRYKSPLGKLLRSDVANIAFTLHAGNCPAKERGKPPIHRWATWKTPFLESLHHHLVDHRQKRIDVERLRQTIACSGGKQPLDL